MTEVRGHGRGRGHVPVLASAWPGPASASGLGLTSPITISSRSTELRLDSSYDSSRLNSSMGKAKGLPLVDCLDMY